MSRCLLSRSRCSSTPPSGAGHPGFPRLQCFYAAFSVRSLTWMPTPLPSRSDLYRGAFFNPGATCGRCCVHPCRQRSSRNAPLMAWLPFAGVPPNRLMFPPPLFADKGIDLERVPFPRYSLELFCFFAGDSVFSQDQPVVSFPGVNFTPPPELPNAPPLCPR